MLERVDRETPDDLLAASEKDTILWDALDQLRPEYRQILLLFHFEDCPQRDIASFLNISVPTVKWRLMRARTALKRRVEEVVRGGPTEARRQQQKQRIAAALPVLALVNRETPWELSPTLFTVLRRGLALGGALTLGVAGSLAYEAQVQSAEAEVPSVADYGRVSVWLGRVSVDGSMASVSPAFGAVGTDPMQDGTVLLPPCSSGKIRRR